MDPRCSQGHPIDTSDDSFHKCACDDPYDYDTLPHAVRSQIESVVPQMRALAHALVGYTGKLVIDTPMTSPEYASHLDAMAVAGRLMNILYSTDLFG